MRESQVSIKQEVKRVICHEHNVYKRFLSVCLFYNGSKVVPAVKVKVTTCNRKRTGYLSEVRVPFLASSFTC